MQCICDVAFYLSFRIFSSLNLVFFVLYIFEVSTIPVLFRPVLYFGQGLQVICDFNPSNRISRFIISVTDKQFKVSFMPPRYHFAWFPFFFFYLNNALFITYTQALDEQ